MKNIRFYFLSLTLGLLSVATSTHAEDIDIFSANAVNSGAPNVLIILDNAASFDASTPACSYADGSGLASLSGKVAGTEQCAMYNTIKNLPTNADGTAAVNLGFMVYSTSGIASANPASGCASSNNGGCLLKPLTGMTATGKANLLSWITSWTMGDIKANNQGNAMAMQEAWAYYAGGTGASGRSYSAIQPPAGCQKNFVIYIGNAYRNNTTPGDNGSPSGMLASAPPVAGVTTTPNPDTTSITIPSGTYGLPPANNSCGSYTMKSHNDTSGLYADEWARYMNKTDIYGALDGTNNIVTYTIGALGPTCDAQYPALLTSMAKYGGGKYFATDANSDSSISDALLTILNEIQAVNSVFSSASLPVSVNAQGTYLNQIFLGMFRPDASANPRWLGNLKQYKFILVGSDPNTAVLKLGDSAGQEALSSAGTGFITPGAISFWTNKDTSKIPDSTGGFYINEPNPTGHDHFDSPDGELVERGGAAQQQRIESLTADFAATAGSASNPRRLYTYCPSGASCVAALTDSSNAFSISNSNIGASAFGVSTTIKINSIVRTGTTALVTTNGNHGFSTGTVVTISGATQTEYNVQQAITVNSATTFTITGLGDHPVSPNAGTYTAALHNSSTKAIGSVALATNSTANANRCASGTIPNINCNQVTVTLPGHGYSNGNLIAIAGVSTNPLLSPNPYSGSFVIGNVTTNTFTYNVPVTPTSPSVNAYSAQLPPPASKGITNIAKSGGNFVVTTLTTHGYTNNQSVTISGNSVAEYNGTWTVASATANTFRIAASGNPGTGNGGSVILNTPVSTIGAGNISRSSATATTATAINVAANAFANGQTILLSRASGTATNETEYAPFSGSRSVTITCTGTCISFTFPISTNTGTATTLTTSSPTAALSSAPVSIPAGAITRASMGTTATVTGVANTFVTGNSIDIGVSGASVGTESAYLSPASGWTITCPVSCSTAFTFGPVTLTPTTPATGSSLQAHSASTPPDKDTIGKWVRGQDNFGDELGPSGSVPVPSPITVRPSIHGDVLHSRPIVINYGDSRGLVVFYGANDGVFRAVNGSQTAPIGTVPAGGELWGLVLPEHFSQLNRLRVNSPELLLASTQLASAQPKDYFVDGSPGVYQKLKADGSIDKAYLYLTMRRGGRFIYALDVSTPTAPTIMWKKSFDDATDSLFFEMGQTWSRPRVTRVKGYTNPVLVFGAGYDSAEDAEPPAADTMGRGIFVLDAVTGARVWSAAYTADTTTICTGSSTQAACAVTGMNWGIAADISFVDRNNDGYTDRYYAADLGGNVWRVDLEPTTGSPAGNTPDKWLVTKLAALGCSSGTCSIGTTPRKFFFAPNVVSVGATGGSGSYDAVMLGAGDREHPLKNTASQSAYNTVNRFYVLKDTNTGMDGGTTPITEGGLFNATSNPYDGSLSGFYTTFATGEKSVNAPVTVSGTTFYGTNKPTPPSATTCSSNLGEARGYQLDPFKGTFTSTVFDGGGLPPTPTTGIVTIVTADGKSVDKAFCIGCGGGTGADSKSALGAGDPSKKVPKNPRRTYWYKK